MKPPQAEASPHPYAELPKKMLKKMRKAARAEILEARAQAHVRTPAESSHPSGWVDVVTWDEASRYGLDDERPLEGRPCYWMGIRGAMYHDPAQWDYPLEEWQDTTGELVPEPDNPADDHAVAIDLDGHRAGYVSATAAAHTHRFVATLRARGTRVRVPVRVRITYNRYLKWPQLEGYAALPTFAQFDHHLPDEEETAAALQPLWDALAPGVVDQIARDYFHLTEDTLHELVELRHLAPSVGLPDRPLLQAVPRSVELFLRDQGAAHRRARSDERTRLMRERNEHILAQHRAGVTVAAIAEEVHLSVGRVRSIVTDATRREQLDQTPPGSPRDNTKPTKDEDGAARAERLAYIARCLDVRQRRRGGAPRSRIAEDAGVDPAMLKTHLSDGKFFENPRANEYRLSAARTIRQRGVTVEDCRDSAERRALHDATLLDRIIPGWDTLTGSDDQAP